MIYMYKIGVIGDYDSICALSALGIDIYATDTAEEAEDTLKKLVQSEYAILYVTEYYLEQMPKLYKKYEALQTPAIIPIPSSRGYGGFGMNNVKKYVEQAVGSDIIFNND